MRTEVASNAASCQKSELKIRLGIMNQTHVSLSCGTVEHTQR